LEEALAMAREASARGVTTITATPHARADYPRVRVEEIAGRCAFLQDQCRAGGIPVWIAPGAEVDLMWASEANQAQLRLASLGQAGAYVLVETPYGALPPAFEDRLFGHITVHGMGVVLAHPERSPTFQKDPKRLAALVKRGVLVQVTAASMLTERRSRSRKLAMSLIREELAHVIASDAHGPGAPRPPVLDQAVRMAAGVAPRRAEWMANAAPEALLLGEPLPPPPADARSRGRRLLNRF
jgi:protein-tyrosine phosphatase